MRPDSIPIVPVPVPDPLAGLSGNAPVVLRETAQKVRRLVDANEASTIDLLAMPLTAADLDWLRESLGNGETHISLDAGGESRLDETGCPGVWWVTHHNEQGGVASAFIEVALVPELVKAPIGDVAAGLERLDLLISDVG